MTAGTFTWDGGHFHLGRRALSLVTAGTFRTGHDFRPDYTRLAALKHNFPDVPVMALTATATEAVRLDVGTILKLVRPCTFTSSFNRPNLWYVEIPRFT